MCRKLALAATALCLIMAPAAFAQAKKPAAKAAEPQFTGKVAPAAPQKATAEQRALADRADPLTRSVFWNQQLSIDPNDSEAALKLAAAQRAMGRHGEAADTAAAVVLREPRNVEALLEVGRSRIAQGQAFYGVENLRQAQELAPRDWRPVSLLGVAYEQVGRTADALAAYEEALRLSPENPAVLSNLAMFHLGTGEAIKAEMLLRRAVARPGATVQMRQNLALVLGLQGKITDAERLLREDLPPDLANNNLAYLKALTDDAPDVPVRTWESLRTGG